jgi:hypothetical protein
MPDVAKSIAAVKLRMTNRNAVQKRRNTTASRFGAPSITHLLGLRVEPDTIDECPPSVDRGHSSGSGENGRKVDTRTVAVGSSLELSAALTPLTTPLGQTLISPS